MNRSTSGGNADATAVISSGVSATASMLATDNAEPVAAASATRPASVASRRPTSTLTGQGDAAVAPTAAASDVASESRSAGRMSRPSIHDIGPA